MATPEEIERAVAECVKQSQGAEYPIRFTFEFVRKLVEKRGWSETDARLVGTQALKRMS